MHTGLATEAVVEKLTTRPRQILRLPAVTVQEGSNASLTIFNPEAEWTFSRSYSKSKNTPFLGQTLRGRVLGILNQGVARWF